ncbi:MAG: hypothetical protein HRT99_03295 [Mycoplasmatales bacterium]|nr:hypothetical protein [Mycoplasmatales bacterium]
MANIKLNNLNFTIENLYKNSSLIDETHNKNITELMYDFINRVMNKDKLDPFFDKLKEYFNNSTNEDEKRLSQIIDKVIRENVLSLNKDDLKHLLMYINSISNNAIAPEKIESLSNLIYKIINNGLKSLEEADFDLISSMIDDNSLVKMFLDPFKDLLFKGINNTSKDNLKSLSNLVYNYAKESFGFDDKVITSERFNNIIYDLLHGYGEYNKEKFKKDLGDLIPALKSMNIKKSVFLVYSLDVSLDSIVDWIYDKDWRITTGLANNAASVSSETTDNLNKIIKYGAAGNINKISQIFKGLNDFVGKVLRWGDAFLEDEQKAQLNSFERTLTKYENQDYLGPFLQELINKPILKLEKKDLEHLFKLLDEQGALNGFFREKDPVALQKHKDSFKELFWKLMKNPRSIDEKDLIYIISIMDRNDYTKDVHKALGDNLEILMDKLLINWNSKIDETPLRNAEKITITVDDAKNANSKPIVNKLEQLKKDLDNKMLMINDETTKFLEKKILVKSLQTIIDEIKVNNAELDRINHIILDKEFHLKYKTVNNNNIKVDTRSILNLRHTTKEVFLSSDNGTTFEIYNNQPVVKGNLIKVVYKPDAGYSFENGDEIIKNFIVSDNMVFYDSSIEGVIPILTGNDGSLTLNLSNEENVDYQIQNNGKLSFSDTVDVIFTPKNSHNWSEKNEGDPVVNKKISFVLNDIKMYEDAKNVNVDLLDSDEFSFLLADKRTITKSEFEEMKNFGWSYNKIHSHLVELKELFSPNLQTNEYKEKVKYINSGFLYSDTELAELNNGTVPENNKTITVKFEPWNYKNGQHNVGANTPLTINGFRIIEHDGKLYAVKGSIKNLKNVKGLWNPVGNQNVDANPISIVMDLSRSGIINISGSGVRFLESKLG